LYQFLDLEENILSWKIMTDFQTHTEKKTAALFSTVSHSDKAMIRHDKKALFLQRSEVISD
jgi:hypothetical protein